MSRQQRAPARNRAVPVLIAVLLVLLGGWGLRRPDGDPTTDQPAAAVDQSLRYPVPPGQDAAAVLATLAVAGYEARMSDERASYDVLVTAPDGGSLSREDVRRVIESAGLDMAGKGALDGPVRFADEVDEAASCE